MRVFSVSFRLYKLIISQRLATIFDAYVCVCVCVTESSISRAFILAKKLCNCTKTNINKWNLECDEKKFKAYTFQFCFFFSVVFRVLFLRFYFFFQVFFSKSKKLLMTRKKSFLLNVTTN
jgi:hypothetical protein